jgi:peptidoglycan/LPS O-acetylase OafA/YrhL
MIHVPIQQATLGVSRAYKLTLPTDSPWMLLVWIVVVITAATATHHGFELPVRRWLRAHQTSAATPVAAAS